MALDPARCRAFCQTRNPDLVIAGAERRLRRFEMIARDQPALRERAQAAMRDEQKRLSFWDVWSAAR